MKPSRAESNKTQTSDTDPDDARLIPETCPSFLARGLCLAPRRLLSCQGLKLSAVLLCSQLRSPVWMEGDDFNTEAVMNICGK
ncbi:hypothetical protein D4764_13G0011430 [Takifugu flavidus]|uniref:Uncharacterized protein n=1 Tax=Takifugu flavidus TaxID=433684 RepID=A0A5C6PCN6_9TELE|nr:hypothetical protein D4764_13G0011430 [Takifugu flavidus]